MLSASESSTEGDPQSSRIMQSLGWERGVTACQGKAVTHRSRVGRKGWGHGGGQGV